MLPHPEYVPGMHRVGNPVDAPVPPIRLVAAIDAQPFESDAPQHEAPQHEAPQHEVPEREVVSVRRAPRSIIVSCFARLLTLLILLAFSIAMVVLKFWPGVFVMASVVCVVSTLALLAWESIKRDAHRYILTTRRVLWHFGVFRKVIVDTPLDRVQNIVVSRTFLQRLCRLGTVRVTTAGATGVDIVIRHVSKPMDVYHTLRERVARYASATPDSPRQSQALPPNQSHMINQHTPTDPQPRRVPVIGLVGGIGAGKSTVALAFKRLGCFVVDSDARSREALDRPEVRDRLVQWWGGDILTLGGRIDRAKVAAIVFATPAERAKLEALVHPIVRQDRATMIQEAGKFWAKAVIVDSPLLFEAGVDKECDIVVYVDAPHDVRVRRVQTTRGWDSAELDRREAAQMPLSEKRSRCRYVIMNAGDPSAINAQVEHVLREVTAA